MKKLLAILIVILGVGLSAQTPNITQYDQQVFSQGVNTVTGTPVWTNTYLSGTALCNQIAPVVPATVTNPSRLFFDDSANPGKVCIVPLSSTLLPALPNGVGFVSTITQTDNIGQASPRSAASNPFGRQGVPSALTGLKVTQ